MNKPKITIPLLWFIHDIVNNPNAKIPARRHLTEKQAEIIKIVINQQERA